MVAISGDQELLMSLLVSRPKGKTLSMSQTFTDHFYYQHLAMGGAVGFGNLLRYPSQVFNNNGLQWFIPYLMAILLLAIPVLILEVSIGQAYRGCVDPTMFRCSRVS
jgi:SNF family Na+-dependent transporter